MKKCFILIALCLASHVLLSQDAAAGFVVQVSGQWTEGKHSQPLKPGQTLFADAKISAPSPCKLGDKLLLAYLDASSVVVTVDCGIAQPSYVVRGVRHRDPWMTGLQKAFLAFLNTELVQVKYAAGRAARGPQDAVIDGSNLAPALYTLAEGDYSFEIRKLGAAQTLAKEALGWRPPQVSLEKPFVLAPGLYLLKMTDRDGEPAGDPATLLVVKPEDFLRYQAAYHEWLEHTGFAHSANDGSVRVLRVALLASLSNNPDMMKVHP